MKRSAIIAIIGSLSFMSASVCHAQSDYDAGRNAYQNGYSSPSSGTNAISGYEAAKSQDYWRQQQQQNDQNRQMNMNNELQRQRDRQNQTRDVAPQATTPSKQSNNSASGTEGLEKVDKPATENSRATPAPSRTNQQSQRRVVVARRCGTVCQQRAVVLGLSAVIFQIARHRRF